MANRDRSPLSSSKSSSKAGLYGKIERSDKDEVSSKHCFEVADRTDEVSNIYTARRR
ncbi:TPA: hypothetical protein V1L15_001984 [Streptococcus pneumoniae]|nr:hypothetical protein [Streptococcus pneumoniae]HEX0279365.1 hypothetical protein [Streptococcus pneumoniae]